MAITTENTKERYVGTGSAATFAYNFKINAASELEVIRANTDNTDQETLVLNTDYTVTGVGASSGNVVLSGGNLATGKVLVILWKGSFVQTTVFENQGGFFPQTHENAFDYVTRLVLRLKEEVARAAKVPVTSSASGDTIIDEIYTAVGDAQDAQTAAEAAQTAAETSEGLATSAKVAAETAQGLAEDAQETAQSYLNDIAINTFEATATAGQTYVDVTGFTLAASLDNVECFIDGVKQAKSSLTRTSSTRLTLGGALTGGEKIEIRSAAFSPTAVNDAVAAAAAADADAIAAAAAAAAAQAYVPSLAGNANKVLTVKADASGTEWKAASSGSGDVAGPASSTDNAVVRFDSTTGKIIQNSNVTIDDNGSINIPAGQSFKVNNVALAAPSSNYFKAHKETTNSQTLSSASWTKITFDVEDYDPNNQFANSRFTPTIAGRYVVSSNVIGSNIGGAYEIAIYKNGSGVNSTRSAAAASEYEGVEITAIIDMNGSTDYLEIYVRQQGSGNKDVFGVLGGIVYTWFQGFLIV
jgi:hypothetical protein